MILLGLAAKNKADSQYDSYHLLSNHFVDSLRGLETLKYLGISKQHIEKIAQVSERYRKETMATLAGGIFIFVCPRIFFYAFYRNSSSLSWSWFN